MSSIRVLSYQGIEKFREFIHLLKKEPLASRPDLNVEPYSRIYLSHIEIDETKKFSTRMEMAEYLAKCFKNSGITRDKIILNQGLWTWLAYIWFDELCPIIKGKRKILEDARYICSSDYTDYYRHYVAGPYDIYTIYGPENSRLFLNSHIYGAHEFTEQFASRQYIMTYPRLIEVAHQLYWNNRSGNPKLGYTNRNKLGNIRRFIKILGQLELTYDIYSMEPKDILSLLPPEFNFWKGDIIKKSK